MDQSYNIMHIEWALQNGHNNTKKKLLKLIKRINVVADTAWEEQLAKNNETHPYKTINYADKNGYVHGKNTVTRCVYMHCRKYVKRSSSALVNVNQINFEKEITVRSHNHEVESKLLEKIIFFKELKKIIRENPFSELLYCYNNAKLSLKNQINNIPTLKRCELFFQKHSYIPLLPTSILQFEKLIRNLNHFCHDVRDSLFFRGVWECSSGKNVVFISGTVLQQVKKLQYVQFLMNGTVKALPLHLKFRQLYIINVIICERCYPLAYILMEKRDFRSYRLIFSKLKLLIGRCTVINCMSDYETAMRKAMRNVFPSASLSGFYFHYILAINRAFKRFGFENDYKFKYAMQKVLALALLPNDFILKGFETISKNFKNSKRWNRFKDYWLSKWAVANISVFGLKYSTNNFAEFIKKTINSLIGSSHPHIWTWINNLKLAEMKKSDELLKVVTGAIIPTKRNRDMVRLNRKIDEVTIRFIENYDVEVFLNNITLNEYLETYFKERLDILDSSYEIDDDSDNENYDDEPVIPNDLKINSNFRQSNLRTAAKKRRMTSIIFREKKLKKKFGGYDGFKYDNKF